MSISYYLFLLKKGLRKLFSHATDVHLAVIGQTIAGKTYLLTDIIGSLERLGFMHDAKLAEPEPHLDKQDLLNQQGVRTPRTPYRREDIYVLPFKNTNDKKHNLTLRFVNISGEAADSQSIKMFNAVKEAFSQCNEKLFEYTLWWKAGTKGVVRTVAFKGDVDKDDFRWNVYQRTRRGDVCYMSSKRRIEELREQRYKEVKTKTVTGRQFFDHFLDYDTDTAMNAIINSWSTVNVKCEVELFNLLYVNDFFCHYFVYKSTDIIVCDKCIAQKDGEGQGDDDAFANMLTALKDMGMEKKRMYLAFKGVDSLMEQQTFKRMYDLTRPRKEEGGTMTDKRDPNLVYSFFLLLLSKACKLKGKDGCLAPMTISEKEARLWLSEDGRRSISDEVAAMAVEEYNSLDGENCSRAFKVDARVNGRPAGEHIGKGVGEFSKLAPGICRTDIDDGKAIRDLLGIPPHTYFVATPVDEDFTFCEFSQDRPYGIEGKAGAYDRRVHFGSLQLTMDLLNSINLCYGNHYKCYGQLLKYCFNQ